MRGGGLVLSGLFVYPMKGARGVPAEAWELDALGLRHDRRWMVVDPDGGFLSQRTHPGLALVRPTLSADALELSGPGWSGVRVPLLPPPDAPPIDTTVWGDRVRALRVSSEADRALTEHLGTPVHLVHFPDSENRPVDPDYAPGSRVGFADGFPLLLISEGSLAELNRRLDDPVPMNRFRPNLVVSGADAFAEDHWRSFRVGRLPFRGVKPCARCKVTTVDQESGVTGKEPLRTLATFRAQEGKVLFGQNVVHESIGRLRLGDPVTIDEGS